MSRLPDPQLSFADFQLQSMGIHLDPTFQRIADFLEEHSALVEMVRKDLERGLKKPNGGRRGITPTQALLSLILMRVKNWDYRELRERINDGYTLRTFTQFNGRRVPKHDAFNRAINRFTPATLAAINQLVVLAAVELGIEDGKKLRADTTVVETNIHYPTDATLLWDTVRTVTRLVWDLHEKLPRGVKSFTDRTRSARRRMQEIQRMSARQREQQQTPKYRELIRITEQVMQNAKHVIVAAKRVVKVDATTHAMIGAICRQISDFSALGVRVIDQTRRRVLHGETVPAEEKLYSIFEPHTDLIKRGKVLKPVEFGHKVFLAESSHGLITEYRVLDGNPADSDHVSVCLDQHKQTFEHAPDGFSADRGFYSVENIQKCKDAGVSVVSIPQRGGQRTEEQEELERSPAFKKGQRFRAGIEGSISVLFRGRGMKRCLAKGRERFEILVGAAVLANNLMRIANLLDQLDKRKPNRGRAAA
jgi:transposase, IS5 family